MDEDKERLWKKKERGNFKLSFTCAQTVHVTTDRQVYLVLLSKRVLSRICYVQKAISIFVLIVDV